MSDFPLGGDVERTRDWLDKHGFRDVFKGWTADAFLGQDEEYIKKKLPVTIEEPDRADILCGLLSTARALLQKVGPSVVMEHYCEGNEVYDFWHAVIRPDAVIVDDTGKKLTFKNRAARWGWTPATDELYIRECYNMAVSVLGKTTTATAILEGTPGIGKSVFIFYYIYVVVKKARDNGETVPTFLIADGDGTEYFLHMDANGNGIVHKPTTALTPDYLITDAVGRGSPSFRKQYLHVSSINNVNVKDVRKLVKRTIYLPVFSVEEYFEIDGADKCDAEKDAMSFYHDVFGGSLRNLRSVDAALIVESDDEYPDSQPEEGIYEVVQAEMESFFGGYQLAGIPKATWDLTAKALAKKLHNPNEATKSSSSQQVDPNTIIKSIIIHWTPSADIPSGWLDVPATRFMRHLAGHICDTTKKKDALSSLREAIGASGMDFVHEHDAHNYRLKHLGKEPGITLWSLEDQPKQTLHVPIKRVVRIRTIRDLELLEEGEYGLPTVSNFALLDAAVKPYAFQDTTAKKNGHATTAKAVEISTAMKMKTTHTGKVMMINTLSTDNFDSFRKNKEDEMAPFSQWKTRIEAHADDLVNAVSAGNRRKRSRGDAGKRKDKKVKISK